MLKTEVIEINPFDLESVTVNDSRVQELMGQIEAAGGILEPVVVWMDSNGKIHVVNGFHRAECARRLNYTVIKAILIDCDESKFWDLRISATTEHKSVTNDRLHLWMLDAWMLTEWAKLDKASFSRTAYSVYDYLFNRLNQPSLLTRQEKSVVEWFGDRAKVWGKDTREIAKIILDKSGLFVHHNNLLNIAVQKHLPYEQYVSAVKALEGDIEARTQGIADKDIKAFIDTNMDSGKPQWDSPTAIKEQKVAEVKQKNQEMLVQQVADQVVRLKGALLAVESIVASGVDITAIKKVQPGIDTQLVKSIELMNSFVEWVSGDYRWNVVALREENARLKQENSDLKDRTNRGPIIVPSSVLAHSSSDLRY